MPLTSCLSSDAPRWGTLKCRCSLPAQAVTCHPRMHPHPQTWVPVSPGCGSDTPNWTSPYMDTPTALGLPSLVHPLSGSPSPQLCSCGPKRAPPPLYGHLPLLAWAQTPDATLLTPCLATDVPTHGHPLHPDQAVMPLRQPSLSYRHLPGSASPNSFRTKLFRKGKVKF